MNLMRSKTRSEASAGLRSIWGRVRSLARDEAGVTAIEYGLLASLIAIAAMSGIASLGGGVGGMWTNLSNAVNAALSS